MAIPAKNTLIHSVIMHWLHARPEMKKTLFDLASTRLKAHIFQKSYLYEDSEVAESLTHLPMGNLIHQVEMYLSTAQQEVDKAEKARGKNSMWYVVANFNKNQLENTYHDLQTLDHLLYELRCHFPYNVQKD